MKDKLQPAPQKDKELLKNMMNIYQEIQQSRRNGYISKSL